MKRLFGLFLLLCLTLTVPVAAFEGAYVLDEAATLSDEQAQELENQAASMAETYDFPVYLVTVDDFTDYGFDDVYECAVAFYEESELGFGDAQDGGRAYVAISDGGSTPLWTKGLNEDLDKAIQKQVNATN